uniref:Uncharacterized protein n=1 Tax=Rhipicephalus zambeziensis TaxID=60191 RepID=A0A224Y8M4_9ACAR
MMPMFDVSMYGFPGASRTLLGRFTNLVCDADSFSLCFIEFLLVTAVGICVICSEFHQVVSLTGCSDTAPAKHKGRGIRSLVEASSLQAAGVSCMFLKWF